MLATPSICKYYIIFKRSLASTEVSAGALAKADQNVGHLESEGMAHGSCLNLFLEAAQYQMDPPPSFPLFLLIIAIISIELMKQIYISRVLLLVGKFENNNLIG